MKTKQPDAKILNMSIPQYTSYSHNASSIAIISEHPDHKNWALNNFNNLIMHEHKPPLYFVDSTYNENPLIETQRIKKSLIGKNTAELMDFIIEAINQEHYVYLIVNVKHIPPYNKNMDTPHDLMIFGYDLTKRLFYIADNFDGGQFRLAECSFEQLQKSVDDLPEELEVYSWFDRTIDLINVKTHATLPIDIPYIINGLSDYVSSSVTHPKNHFVRGNLYGISVYDRIIEYLSLMIEGQAGVDIRPLHVLWEHKKSILYKISYFNDRLPGYLNEEFDKYNYFESQTLKIRNVYLKSVLSEDYRILSRVIKELSEIKIQEFDVLSGLIHKVNGAINK